MVTIEDLKKIRLYENLTDGMLEKILPVVQEREFKERKIIYEADDAATDFYSLKRGKVLLEAELAPNLIISLGAIKPGYSFGWPALIRSETHTSYAVAAEPSEIFVISGSQYLDLLDSDENMGYLVMRNAAAILENRLEHRTGQFLKSISKHPEIRKLFGLGL